MDTLLLEMANLKVQIANVKEKRKNPLAPRHNLWMSVPIPASEVITIPSSPKGWPSDSAWDTFGVSTRSKGETKSVSTREEKKKKGKKPVEVPIETSSDSDFEPVKQDIYKDDISSMVREALKSQTQGKENATLSNEVRPTLEVNTLANEADKAEPITLSAKLDYDFVKNLSETPAQISMLQLIVHSPKVLKQLNAWSRGHKKTARGMRRRKKMSKDESIAAYAITEEDRGAPEVETLFGGIPFLLNYVVLKPQDENGYEMLRRKLEITRNLAGHEPLIPQPAR
ncbi:hypothetical protein R1sor_013418 [Riccia sorocarpa]|uniref:Uncharacterized protein n=1 Tax=Riccia sorocarpa TaxID=122646 RepID=A0ABD3HCN7_9MARC